MFNLPQILGPDGAGWLVLLSLAVLGVGLLALGVGLFLISRVGRFETRMHDRFDYVNHMLQNGARENTVLNVQKHVQKFMREPDLNRAYLQKTAQRIALMEERLGEFEELLRTGGAGSGNASGNGRKTLPEKNRALVAAEFKEGVAEVRSWPEELTLAVTTRCNINPPCGICERNTHSPEEEYDISPQVITNLMPVFPHLDVLYLHCGGEPTYSRYFRDVIDLVDAPTKIRFNTHGLSLDEDLARFLVERRNVDCINVSLDAGTAGTHKKLRGGGFERILRNLVRLREIKHAAGVERPTVILNMCITAEALEEIPLLVDLAAEVGAAGVDYFHMNTGPQFDWIAERPLSDGGSYRFDYAAQQRFDRERHDALLREAYEKARSCGLGFNFVGRGFLAEELDAEQQAISLRINERAQLPEKCAAPWSRAVVSEDGRVRLCYFHHEERDLVGSIAEQDFRSVWNSPAAQEIRRQMHAHTFADVCKCTENVCVYRGRL